MMALASVGTKIRILALNSPRPGPTSDTGSTWSRSRSIGLRSVGCRCRATRCRMNKTSSCTCNSKVQSHSLIATAGPVRVRYLPIRVEPMDMRSPRGARSEAAVKSSAPPGQVRGPRLRGGQDLQGAVPPRFSCASACSAIRAEPGAAAAVAALVMRAPRRKPRQRSARSELALAGLKAGSRTAVLHFEYRITLAIKPRHSSASRSVLMVPAA